MPFLVNLLTQLPILLVCFVGIVLAIVRWQCHPRVSLLTLIGIGLFLLDLSLNIFLNVGMPLWFARRDVSVTQIGTFLAVKSILASLLVALAWGLLLAAIFSGRKPTPENKR